jgi:hypothetical protein
MGYTFKDVPRHVRDYHPYISATRDTRFRGYSYTQKYSKLVQDTIKNRQERHKPEHRRSWTILEPQDTPGGGGVMPSYSITV